MSEALSKEQAAALRQAIVDSPWLGATTLNMRFAATWGFSVAFRSSGVEKVYRTFPAFRCYLERVLEPRYNAFFLNPLVIFRGGQVQAHIDCSLRSYTAPLEPPYPGKVSVYYAQVPSDLEGGELQLSTLKGRLLESVRPVPNMIVQFDGDLMHQVTPFHGSDDAQLDRARISLVCEHYDLPDNLLSRIPEFHLETSRKFEEFFEKALDLQEMGDNS